MPKFSVGIHENVVLTKALINDKDQLVIGFKEAGEIDLLGALNGTGSTSVEPKEQDFIPFSPKVENFGKASTWKQVFDSLADYKDQLDHILSAYMTADKRKWDAYKGTDITKANLETRLTDQSVVDVIVNNINKQFVELGKPFAGENGKKLRILFVRQSAAKHWPTFRKKFLDNNPFIEPMDIPVSKLKFTAWEIANGFNNPNPAGQAATVSSVDAAAADKLFN